MFLSLDNTRTPECNSLSATGRHESLEKSRANSHLPDLSSTLFLVFPELYEEVGVPSDTHKTSGYKTYEEPKMSQENPGYTELDKNTLQGRNATDDSTYHDQPMREESRTKTSKWEETYQATRSWIKANGKLTIIPRLPKVNKNLNWPKVAHVNTPFRKVVTLAIEPRFRVS
jgi:hypothetical protein